VVLALGGWSCLAQASVTHRLMGPLAAGLLLPACLLRVAVTQGGQRTGYQYVTLALGVLTAALTSWAWMVPAWDEFFWLYAGGLLLGTCAPFTILYGVVLTQYLPPESGWPQRTRAAGTGLGFLAVGLLAAVLGQEVLLFGPGAGPRTLPAVAFVAAVAAAGAALIVVSLCLALVPGFDPFRLTERGRTAYVYAGEVLLVIILVHLRLTVPGLFRRDMGPYWTYAILGVAFLGAAAAELFRRLEVRVLSEPLEVTGVYLPVVPALAFWVQPPEQYATVMFLAGLLYALLAVVRRSLGFALVAALAANAGLWAVLHGQGLAFVRHPQLWLIPLALTVLAAEHLNRDRLTRAQRNSTRYLALTVIYVSSAAETLLMGLDVNPVRPVVLITLSVLGVLGGMVLRVRAFLFLGSVFLLLGVYSMIRFAAHAAGDRSRVVWSAAGIVLGLVIFTFFAVFEKRRNKLLGLLKKLREWD
jgi:hypothetical protein